MARTAWIGAVLIVLVGTLVAASPAASPNFPPRIDFPPGWSAEGIATGKGHSFYAGNTANGAVYAGDFRTGEGAVLVPPVAGRSIFGVYADNRGRIFAAGGRTGHAYVFDAATGALIRDYVLTVPAPPAPAPNTTLINDVVVTNDGAYFTNTNSPLAPTESALFKIPIAPDGELGDVVEKIPVPFPGGNGIEAASDGKTLVVNSITLSALYAFDTATHATTQIAASETARRPDGMILRGKTLYVCENLPNAAFPGAVADVAVYELSPDFTTATAVAHLNSASDPLLNAATADAFGDHLWVVRRDAPAPAPAAFHLTRLDLK
jgi:sugar lactone lactonase YvrE